MQVLSPQIIDLNGMHNRAKYGECAVMYGKLVVKSASFFIGAYNGWKRQTRKPYNIRQEKS